MDVRKFLDLYPILYADQPKRTAADALADGEDLQFVETEAGLIAVDKTGCVFRKRSKEDTGRDGD